MNKDQAFLINGKFSKNKLVLEVIKALKYRGIKINLYTLNLNSSIVNILKGIIETKTTNIVICGGDGTVNEVMNGYMLIPEDERKSLVFGLLPAGTGNDFSRTLGIRKSTSFIVNMIIERHVSEVDLGGLNFNNSNGESDYRFFINITDVGIGGLVVQIKQNQRFLKNPTLVYAWSIIKAFFKFKPPEIEFTNGDYKFTGKCLSVCLANGKYFGGGMCIAPDANIHDGLFEIIILGKVTLMDYIFNMRRIRKGIKIIHKEVIYTQSESGVISSFENCPIDMDGEFIGFLPLKYNIVPKAVKLLIPKINER